jgi:molecular chaperone HtpG
MGKSSTYKFQTEARELLDLMINSVYSNKEIFLRELISNASDAIDKLRFEALGNKELEPFLDDPHIRVERDEEGRTVTVSDTGIGMNRDELRQFIGVIAKSGTKEYVSLINEAKKAELPPELIGQFGVGFYSTFMVAEKVTLTTRRAGEEQAWRWESVGDGTYSVAETEKERPGTTVVCHLKDIDDDAGIGNYADEWTVRGIVKKYSDFVGHPIRMAVEKPDYPLGEDGKPDYSKEAGKKVEDEVLNSMKAIWTRPETDVTDEEYNEFYRHLSKAWDDPMTRIVTRAEGMTEFRMLLYIPEKAPFDLYVHDAPHGISLFIRRVFIMNDCKDLLPRFLRFIKGVVDSEDLPLNISREILQQDGNIRTIKKHLIRKVFSTLADLKKDDNEKYLVFWKEFGKVLKEGLFEDPRHNEKILDLSLFDSTNSAGEPTDLDGYIERMKEGQDTIYYLTGKSRAGVEASPHLEAFKKKGYEVLLLSDSVDEVWVQSVQTHKNKKFQSAAKGTVELGTEEERKEEEENLKEKEDSFKDLMSLLQKKLDEHVKEVRLSTRLTDSPACLVGDAEDLSPQLEAMLRASGQEMPNVKRILELNAEHAILQKLQSIFDLNQEDERLGRYAQVLFGQAVLAEGRTPPDPATFSQHLTDVMIDAVK